MAKAIFSGSISFGLVNIPVKVYPAVKDKRVAFRTLHKECHTPLIHKRWCPTCNREVKLEEVEKGYQLSKDRFVVLTDEELERVQLKTLKVLEIIGFVDAAEIDPLYYDFPYLLEPQEGGEKAYTLLREILSQTGKVAIGRVVMRNKEYVVVLRTIPKGPPHGDPPLPRRDSQSGGAREPEEGCGGEGAGAEDGTASHPAAGGGVQA
jgi:DNA end-binding protein Ku